MVSIPSETRCAHSPVGACGLRHPPVVHSLQPNFRLGLNTRHSPEGVLDRLAARWREDWSCCCRGIPQSAPNGLFLFEKILLLNPAAPYKEGPVLSLSPPLLLDGDCLHQGPTGPNSQLSPASTHSLHVFTILSLFPSLQLQATRSLSVLLKPCLAGEGAISTAVSQESCGRPGGRWPGAAVALVPTLVPGTLLF